jgi:hypothetical protein
MAAALSLFLNGCCVLDGGSLHNGKMSTLSKGTFHRCTDM